MKFEFFLCQIAFFAGLWKLKVPFCDFIQNMSQAPSKCLTSEKKWIDWIILKIYDRIWKIYFVFYEYLERLEGPWKLESAYSFMLKYSEMPVQCSDCSRSKWSYYVFKIYRKLIFCHKIEMKSQFKKPTLISKPLVNFFVQKLKNRQLVCFNFLL